MGFGEFVVSFSYKNPSFPLKKLLWVLAFLNIKSAECVPKHKLALYLSYHVMASHHWKLNHD